MEETCRQDKGLSEEDKVKIVGIDKVVASCETDDAGYELFVVVVPSVAKVVNGVLIQRNDFERNIITRRTLGVGRNLDDDGNERKDSISYFKII